MSKKVQKTLTAALATTLATGSMAIPAMAETKEAKANVDDLYKAAYEATIKTQDLDKVTQGDINVAREAIDAIRGTSVASAVPTFSAIVDKAQQKFLEVAYNSIVKCQETGTQKDINTARSNIQDLPLQFKNPYSMAIDVVQQKVIDKVYAAVEEAIKTQKPDDIKKAQALLDDILTVVHNDGVKKWAVETEVRFKKATAVLNIVSAEALNNNSVTILFNRPIDPKSATSENFSVSPKGEAYDNLVVDKVQVSEDGMSVKVHTINTFENKKDYVVNVSKIKDTFGNEIIKNASAEFNYQVAAVKSIAFTSKNVPLGADLKNYVEVKDALGRNVTDEYKDKLTFTTADSSLVTNEGIVPNVEANDGKHVMVGVTVSGTEISTSSVLTITKLAATTFQGYAIVADNSYIDKTFSQLPNESKLSYVTVGQENVKLVVGFKNQQGQEIPLNDSSFIVEKNYNPTIAMVNINKKGEAVITALSEGTAYVKIKCGDIEKTVSIQVKAASLPGEISTSKENYNLVASNTSGINIDYSVVNQFGEKYKGNSNAEFENKSGSYEKDTIDKSQLLTTAIVKNSRGEDVTDKLINVVIPTEGKNNEITIKPVSGATLETGVYKVTLERTYKYKGDKKTIKRNLTINVINGGTPAGYQVQLNNNKLDINPNNTNNTPRTATVTVYKVDADGNRLGTVPFGNNGETASLQVLNSEGVEVNNIVSNDKINPNEAIITPEKDGTYKVNVRVGGTNGVLVKQLTITVVNTKSEPTTIVFNSKATTINEATSIKQILENVGCTLKDQYGATVGKGIKDIKGIDCLIGNQSGASINNLKQGKIDLNSNVHYTGLDNSNNPVNQGNLTLVINSIKVANPTTENANNTKTIYFNTPVSINITVNSNAKLEATATIRKDFNINNVKEGDNILDKIKEKIIVKNDKGEIIPASKIAKVNFEQYDKNSQIGKIGYEDTNPNNIGKVLEVKKAGYIDLIINSVTVDGINNPINISGKNHYVRVNVLQKPTAIVRDAAHFEVEGVDGQSINITEQAKKCLIVTKPNGKIATEEEMKNSIITFEQSNNQQDSIFDLSSDGMLTIKGAPSETPKEQNIKVLSVKLKGMDTSIELNENNTIEVKATIKVAPETPKTK